FLRQDHAWWKDGWSLDVRRLQLQRAFDAVAWIGGDETRSEPRRHTGGGRGRWRFEEDDGRAAQATGNPRDCQPRAVLQGRSRAVRQRGVADPGEGDCF